MDRERRKQIKELFEAALDHDPERRSDFLASECAGDSPLRNAVDQLLAAYAETEGFMESPAADPTAILTLMEEGNALAGAGTIGPYRILECLGQGGMGTVYLAEQKEPIRRQVALKVIKPGMDSEEVLARFEAERQALASMGHANISKIFDAGTTERGRPYFAMEYAAGVPITQYCDQHGLSTRTRLNLFVQVCQAIQHAHQKGIIHRDIKPSNVLVSRQDGVPVPKVIDFGIAKATAESLSEDTGLTAAGSLIGTPEYMSPEQAEISQDLDTRTDIYSLGVMLYELLAGKLPFETEMLRRVSFDEMRRIIKEDTAPLPSTRLSGLGADAANVAERRQTTSGKLQQQLRGDLDWIVMKAMEKDRTRRYASASEFAADVARHFDNEPVTAGPQSSAYRLRKFVRKHRVGVAATAAIGATIVVLGSLSIWLGQQALRQAENVRANGILASAAASVDPVEGALLVLELANLPPPVNRLKIAHEIASEPIPIVVRDHGMIVTSVDLSPDGSQALTGVLTGPLGGAWIWRTDGTGDPVVLLHEGVVHVTFSPDGSRVMAASMDGTARIWRADGAGEPVVLGTPRAVDREFDPSLEFIALFTPDGNLVVTAGIRADPVRDDYVVQVWRADGDGEPVALNGHEGPVTSVDISADGKRVVTASLDGTARVWPIDGTGEPVVLGEVDIQPRESRPDRLRSVQNRLSFRSPVGSAAFSPDGSLVATGHNRGIARVWSSDGMGDPVVFDGLEGAIRSVDFSPDGIFLITASAAGLASVWPVDGTGRPQVLTGHSSQVSEAVFSADGSSVITASMDGTARVWNTPSVSFVMRGHEDGITSIALSRDGKLLLTGSDDGTARLWRADLAGEPEELLPPSQRRLASSVGKIAFSPDGAVVATAHRDQTIHLWPVEDGRAPVTLGDPVARPPREDRVQSVAFSPDGTLLLTTHTNGSLRVWHADGSRELIVLPGHEGRRPGVAILSAAAFSADGTYVLTAERDDAIPRIWRADGGGEPQLLVGHEGGVWAAVFSPDGTRVLTASRDGTARVWNVDDEIEPIVLSVNESERAEMTAAAFSPDGRRVLAGSEDGTIRLWRADGGGEPVVFRGHEGEVVGASFSPDGERILTSAADGTARVWHADGAGEPVVLQVGAQGSVRPVTATFNSRADWVLIEWGARPQISLWRADGIGDPIVLKADARNVGPAIGAEVAWSPDGTRVVTAGGAFDDSVALWRVTWPDLLDYLRASTTACLTPEKRARVLSESPSEAWEAYAACEQQYNRTPQSPGR